MRTACTPRSPAPAKGYPTLAFVSSFVGSEVKSSIGKYGAEEIMSKCCASMAMRTTRERRVAAGGFLYLVVSILLPAPLIAGAPTEQIRATVDRVLAIVRNSELKAAG